MSNRAELIAAGAIRPREPSDVTRSRGFDHGVVLRLDAAGLHAAAAHVRQGPMDRFVPLAELLTNKPRRRRARR